MDDEAMAWPPLTVTGEYSISIKKPTPINVPLYLVSHVISRDDIVVDVKMTLMSRNGKDENNNDCAEEKLDIYASGKGTFHWIYPRQRWSA